MAAAARSLRVAPCIMHQVPAYLPPCLSPAHLLSCPAHPRPACHLLCSGREWRVCSANCASQHSLHLAGPSQRQAAAGHVAPGGLLWIPSGQQARVCAGGAGGQAGRRAGRWAGSSGRQHQHRSPACYPSTLLHSVLSLSPQPLPSPTCRCSAGGRAGPRAVHGVGRRQHRAAHRGRGARHLQARAGQLPPG